MFEVKSDIDVDAPAEVVFSVLWDVARYPDFMTDMVDSWAHPSDNPLEKDATHRVQFIRSRTYTVHLRAEPSTSITWKLVQGENMRINEGHWHIRPREDGAGCSLEYLLRIELALKLPDAIVKRLTAFNLPTMMRQVKAYAEHQQRLRAMP